jgi:hypothetical protein
MLKNSIGYVDDINNVIYVELPNGKFTIQESSFSAELNAVKRLLEVRRLGIKYSGGEIISGTVAKTHVSGKGTWYRARFGEFTTLNEARLIAAKLKPKK